MERVWRITDISVDILTSFLWLNKKLLGLYYRGSICYTYSQGKSNGSQNVYGCVFAMVVLNVQFFFKSVEFNRILIQLQ